MIEGDGGRADIAGRHDTISAIVRKYCQERYMPKPLLVGINVVFAADRMRAHASML